MLQYKVSIESQPNYIKEWVCNNLTNPYTYQGTIDLKSGLYEGKGRIRYLVPSNPIQTYIGTFSQGKITGSGTIWYSDGTIYKGQVLGSQRNGFGTMYGSDGKYQYDGMWVKDHIDKPIYTPVLGPNGLLVSQGYQVNGEYSGWFVTHGLGTVESFKFYQNGKAIKGFGTVGSSEQNVTNPKYMVKYDLDESVTNTLVSNFLTNDLNLISKPGNLQAFLSQESNLKMLDALSFDYDPDTGGIKENTPYKVFEKENGLHQIMIYDNEQPVELSILPTGSVLLCTGNLESQDKIQGSIWSIQPSKRNNIKLVKGSDGIWVLDQFEESLVSKGEYIKSNGTVELNGEGWYKDGNKIYKGTFVSSKITDGIEEIGGKKKYEGKFNSSGKYHGVGTEFFTGSNQHKVKYQGEFSNGKYHGNGSSYYPNSETESIEYVGNWTNGYKHGQGTLFSVSGDEIFTGEFDHDQIA